jgi:hypothetical protein
MTKLAIALAIAGLLTADFAAVAELVPGSCESVHLGHLNGVVYYTIEKDGCRVVTTIADGDAGLPVRFVATLSDGQKLTISVPGNLGVAPQEFEFSRASGKIFVRQTLRTRELMSVNPVPTDE